MPSDTPLVLGFDTSGSYCAAALLRGDESLATRHEDMGRGQAERLMPMLEEMLAEVGVDWRDLGRIGVGVGPGNFTGVRISVSAARGLALGLDVPALGVSLLDAAVWASDGPCLACLSAPRDRAYVQGYHTAASIPAQLHDIATLPTHWAEPGLTCIGPASDPVAEHLGADIAPAAFSPASAIARIAAQRDVDGAPSPAPLYLREADAAPSREGAPVILDAR
ncbi:tRNA (adenosine(37)-N6)-threonylcarbamoyltransferase complex dimerization subunit type 1 TsaB [Rhodalgimonas zhirmunskyi]|uniref:tRNA (Adenosine(37)-N6)-threonylcarbamoyltransferase complex dimerization subunit type 1 TsaB n=1 Tax=Rhodalgimonas zhirmunskyi TaxID=2964767 RepID=A0AAJ1X6F3_9RHOB|nr:tRNA (adenosine(37)-N6)-threonylcarbamoyltransferase complex dimerization subunit type 1 TsaB [Rhodoalgimonas zhirmunskyi]MDQ2094674.1 tRNA (adenosine(37)-N6)-threonylcarbamoyltransferase complex dimerization subunit type 1 TsaB [Rhodoalgimonas zhirmunskyi]